MTPEQYRDLWLVKYRLGYWEDKPDDAVLLLLMLLRDGKITFDPSTSRYNRASFEAVWGDEYSPDPPIRYGAIAGWARLFWPNHLEEPST